MDDFDFFDDVKVPGTSCSADVMPKNFHASKNEAIKPVTRGTEKSSDARRNTELIAGVNRSATSDTDTDSDVAGIIKVGKRRPTHKRSVSKGNSAKVSKYHSDSSDCSNSYCSHSSHSSDGSGSNNNFSVQNSANKDKRSNVVKLKSVDQRASRLSRAHAADEKRHSVSDSNSFSDSDSYSSYSSDSDVTDVSPLGSPRENNGSSSQRPTSAKPPASPGYRRYTNDPAMKSQTNSKGILQANKDTINMKLLMQAILEMERERSRSQLSTCRTDVGQKQPKQQVKPFVVPRAEPGNRKNFSFKNDRVRDIDKENQRLMQNILELNKKKSSKKPAIKRPTGTGQDRPLEYTRRVTTAELNRQREQKRIDEENRAMLRRLQGTRSTDGLRKGALIDNYTRQVVNGIHSGSRPEPHRGTRTRSFSANPYSGSSYLDDDLTYDYDSNKRSQRPRSAYVTGSKPAIPTKTRPLSAHQMSTKNKGSRPSSAHVVSTMSAGDLYSSSKINGKKSNRPKSAHTDTYVQKMAAPKPAWENGW